MAGGVSADEVAQFGRLAEQWWDPSGPMRELHRMNPLRVGWIEARSKPAASLLDVGCGAGLASEALADAGYRVTGVDASADAIAAARAHATQAIDYETGTAEDVLASGRRFATVTALEIIEHIPDQSGFMATLAALLEPGGLLFVSTINRTLRSLVVAKIGAEYVAQLLPAGTHDWRRFVKPEELAAMGRAAGLRLQDVAGMRYDPATRGWRESRELAINYIVAFAR